MSVNLAASLTRKHGFRAAKLRGDDVLSCDLMLGRAFLWVSKRST